MHFHILKRTFLDICLHIAEQTKWTQCKCFPGSSNNTVSITLSLLNRGPATMMVIIFLSRVKVRGFDPI